MSRHLVVVDGSNLMARAWFTMREPSLETFPEKIRVMLSGIQQRWSPTHLVMALDSPSCFRLEAIPGYKADRKKTRKGPGTSEMTEALRPAFAFWNVAVREADGLEADDVIAALVRKAVEISCPVSVLSKDTDLLQLVHDAAGVRVLWPEGGGEGESALGEDGVRAYLSGHKDFGSPIGPEHLLDLRTIAGGKDNLPRIEIRGPDVKPPFGFTTRRAAELLSKGATLDSLLGADRHLLNDREQGWMTVCRAAALERREALRLRAAVEPVGSGSSSVADQRIQERYHRDASTPATSTRAAGPAGMRTESVKVPCAGGCGRMETAEPHHQLDQVYCFSCGVKAGREDAARRKLEREAAHV